MKGKNEVCILAAAGMLGSTFDKEAFLQALSFNPDVIGCDSGTSDSGPFYPGAGIPRMNRKAVKRDLELMIEEGVRRGIPVLVGSAGTSGADAAVDWMVEIVCEIAAEKKLHFKLAEIKTELTREQLSDYMKAGKLQPLEGAPNFNHQDIDSLVRCISVTGVEPFIKAVADGAQVVVCGRCTDASIYAAIPIMYGLDNGYAWHAAKILECGTLATVLEKRHGSMLAWIREDSASLEAAASDMEVSTVSAAAHSLYENSNPFYLVEPGHNVVTKDAAYIQETNRRVKITGSRVEKVPYTIKLEGVKFEGYRRVSIAGISDPLILRQFDSWIEKCLDQARKKIQRGMGIPPDQYRMRHIVYGNPSDPNTTCVGVVFDIVAQTEEDADGIISNVWHTVLHVPIEDWEGAQSQAAFPFSPPDLATRQGGATYSFCLNHIITVEDPLETCRIHYRSL